MAMKLGGHNHLGEFPYREIQADRAVTFIQEREFQADMEHKKNVQRRRRREKTIQMNIEQAEFSLTKARAAEDRVERQKFIREATSAVRKARATENILARGLEPSDTHMEDEETLDEMEKEILGLGSEDEEYADVDKRLDDSVGTLLSLGTAGDETEYESSEPNAFIRKSKGSNSEQNIQASTPLSNSTAPEKTNDSSSEQSETSGPFDDRDDVPSGRNLLVLVDPSRAARLFGPVSMKQWKPSEPFSSVNYTISKDNTEGECARQAKLFAHFGQKMKLKQCGFGSAHREEDMLLEDVHPDVPLTFEGGRSTHTGRDTPNKDYSSSDVVKLHGGLTKNGRPAELVRATKNGKVFSVATWFPIHLEAVITEGIRLTRSLSEEAKDDEAILRSMARRKRSATAAELAPKRCREPGCDKEFKRPCDLTKHEKAHSRPWKCCVESCQYHEYGWPTEEEQDRHYNDKHSASAIGIAQYTRRIAQRQREQSNGDERFLRR